MASLQTTADKWVVGKFWTHMEWRHAQGPGTTSLYPANTEHGEVGGSEDQRAWFSGGERGKSIFMVPAQALLGRCPVGMAYYPKEASCVGTTRCTPWGIGREKWPRPWQERVSWQTSKQNTLPCLAMEGRHTGRIVMVGQYTQTRQRKLRVKTVKSGHGRHYKRRVLLWTKGENEGTLKKK